MIENQIKSTKNLALLPGSFGSENKPTIPDNKAR